MISFTKTTSGALFVALAFVGIDYLQAFQPHVTPRRNIHGISSSSSINSAITSGGRIVSQPRQQMHSQGTHRQGSTYISPFPQTVARTTSSSTSLNGLINTAVLSASLSATAKLLSSIGIGALTTPVGPKQFGNILDGAAVSALSKLTYWLFQPCFLLCGVATTLAKACSGTGGLPTNALMVLPLAALVQISLGALAAKCITTKRFGIRPLLLGIDVDDDAGASDIQMCTTFANSGPLPTILSDALFRGELLTDVAACISFYLLVWSPLFWTLGKIILGLNEKNEEDDRQNISQDAGIQISASISKIIRQVKTLLSPPVIGSCMGIIIGSNSFLRSMFLTTGAPLAPVFGAFRTFGVAYLPAAVLVLAGSLFRKDASTPNVPSNDSKKSAVHPKTIMSLIFSRFVLSPFLALTTVRLLSAANLLPVDNPRTLAIVTFTLLMEGCMPPAQNSVVMLQLADEKARAGKMAKLLTVIYVLSSVPVTLLLSGCLGISGILSHV